MIEFLPVELSNLVIICILFADKKVVIVYRKVEDKMD